MVRKQGWFVDDTKIGQIKFQPVKPFFYNKQHQLRCQRRGRYFGPLKWYSYRSTNLYNIHTIANNLHYKACHAPYKVQIRWHYAWLRFIKQHKI